MAGFAALALTQHPEVAYAHHGDTGEYLRSAPVLVSGEISSVEEGFPHASIVVQTTGTASRDDVSPGFAALEQSEGERVLDDLQQAVGQVRLVFDPILTGDLGDAPPLVAGQNVVAVAYPRCVQGSEYDNELRVQAIRLPDGVERLRRDASVVDYVDACAAGEDPQVSTAPLLDSSPDDPDRGTPPVTRVERQEDAGSIGAISIGAIVIGVAGILVGGIMVAALVVVRRRLE